MRDLPQWTVGMKVTRHITMTVEAADEKEARAKAEAWEIIGGEQEGETVDWRVMSVSRDA